MVKQSSKNKKKSKDVAISKKSVKKPLREKFTRLKNPDRIKLHKSFKRSYREDYLRDLEAPGIMSHLFETFKILFKNWKLFLPLLTLSVLLAVVLVGLMSEDTYRRFQEILDETSAELGTGDINNIAKAGLLLISTVTTGGLSGTSSEAAGIFSILIFLMLWLVTIFLLRHLLAGHKVKLRDGLYNAMTPLLSTLVVLLVIFIQCIPLIILVVAYSAAIETDFLATPFYALVFFIFASLMLLLSGYLLSSSLIALVAVSAPGLYPLKALYTAADLMMGRRIRFILRVLALILALAFIWALVMIPLILLDLWLKTFEWTAGIPFIPLCLLIMVCFSGIFASTYFYLYYRWLLNFDEK